MASRLKGWLMGKTPSKSKASPSSSPKRRRRTSIRTMKGDLQDILDDLIALASTDPYLTDAQAFLTQAIVMIEKQIIAEGGPKPEPKP